MRFAINILTCLSLSAIILSCEGDYLIEFEWTDMVAEHTENSDLYPQLSSADSIPASIYGLRLNMTSAELSRSGRYLDPESPPENTNGLRRLSIYSNQHFDENHPVGSDLNDLFVILNGSYFSSIAADGSEGYYISNARSEHFEDDAIVERIDLLLMAEPVSVLAHEFHLEFELLDGTILTDTLSPIYLY